MVQWKGYLIMWTVFLVTMSLLRSNWHYCPLQVVSVVHPTEFGLDYWKGDSLFTVSITNLIPNLL